MLRPGESRRNLEGLSVEYCEGDLLLPATLDAALKGCSVLYHLAAIYAVWMPDEQVMYDVNVQGSRNILAAAERAGIRRVIYTSSIAALGYKKDGIANEETPWNWGGMANTYIRSKYEGEQVALEAAGRGVDIVIVNPGFPFGERDTGPTPTGQMILEVLRGRIPFYIDGGVNVVDVKDVAAGHLLAEKHGVSGRRYILGNRNVTIQELYQLVANVTGKRAPRLRLPLSAALLLGGIAGQVADRITHAPPPITLKSVWVASRHMWYDCTRARNELGLPQAPIEDAIRRAALWYGENGYLKLSPQMRNRLKAKHSDNQTLLKVGA
jgi:dihydroflavonol-4-reductase